MTYDELIEGGESAIESLIGKQETLQLEFKANIARDAIFEDGMLTKPGKKHLAKEASAFANSAGGVIVFGVDCRKTTNGVDEAVALTPIPEIRRAETSVREAAADLLQPRHDGIRVSTITTAADPTLGFVIVDVPRSARRPHRSEAADQKQYFKRAGGSSHPMEHYDIEDAFKRTSSPSLELETNFSRRAKSGDERTFYMVVGIRNVGEVTAKSVLMQMWDRSGEVYGSAIGASNITHFKGRYTIAPAADFVVHPGAVREFCTFTFKVSRSGRTLSIARNPLGTVPIGFNYAFGAENMRFEEKHIDLVDDIRRAVTEDFSHD